MEICLLCVDGVKPFVCASPSNYIGHYDRVHTDKRHPCRYPGDCAKSYKTTSVWNAHELRYLHGPNAGPSVVVPAPSSSSNMESVKITSYVKIVFQLFFP